MKQFLLMITFLMLLSCGNNATDKTSGKDSLSANIGVIPGLLGKMGQKDTLFLHFENTGCQAHIKQQLLFYYHNNTIFAGLKTEIPNIDKEFPVLKTQLPDSALKNYEIFENELKRSAMDIASEPCPTITEKYTLYLKKDTIKLKKTCTLHDKYKRLKNAIFGTIEIRTLEKSIYR
jgi:hypothetical protein